jgi:hypothetical protein
MKNGLLIVSFALLLASCGSKGAGQLDKKMEGEFINVMVYHARPTILDGDLAKAAPQADAYWKIVSRWMPGTPQDFDFRSGLAWIYCKWGLYKEAGIILGGDSQMGDAAKNNETLWIYVSLLNGDPPEKSRQLIAAYPDPKFLLFSRKALLAIADGNLSPAIAEDAAFRMDEDETKIFQSISFLNKLLIKNKDGAEYIKGMEPINEAALNLFLSGKDWGAYLSSLKAGEPNFLQTILFDDMTAIMGENADLYAIVQNDQKRAFWLSKLNDIKGVLKERNDNRLTWIEFLIEKK